MTDFLRNPSGFAFRALYCGGTQLFLFLFIHPEENRIGSFQLLTFVL